MECSLCGDIRRVARREQSKEQGRIHVNLHPIFASAHVNCPMHLTNIPLFSNIVLLVLSDDDQRRDLLAFCFLFSTDYVCQSLHCDGCAKHFV